MLEGLKLTFAGMSMVFSFLVLLMGVIQLSSLFFKPSESHKVSAYPNQKEQVDIPTEIAAAVSVAVEAYESELNKDRI